MDSQAQHSLECLLESPAGIRCDKSMMPLCLERIRHIVLYLDSLYAKVQEIYMCSTGRYYMLECYEEYNTNRRHLIRFIEVEHKMKILDYWVAKQEKTNETNTQRSL